MIKLIKKTVANINKFAVIFILCLCNIYICVIGFYFYKLYTSEHIGNGIYPQYTHYFKCSGKDNVDFSFLLDDRFKKVTVIQNLQDSDVKEGNSYKAVVLGKNFEFTNGRTFTRDDYKNNKPTAIIGKDLNTVFKTNPLVISGKTYDVLGTFESKDIKSQNYIAFYTDGRITEMPSKNVYAFFSDNRFSTYSDYNALCEALKSQGLEIKEIDINMTAVTDFLSSQKVLPVLIGFSAFMLILVNILTLILFLYSEKQYIAVLTILGVRKIYSRVFSSYIKMYAIALLVSFAVAALIIRELVFELLILLLVVAFAIIICSISMLLAKVYFGSKEMNSILENDNE